MEGVIGKILKVVATIALVVAVAWLAPQLAPFLVSTLGVSTAVATAIATFGLTLAASALSKAIGLTPKVGAPSARQGPSTYRQAIAETQIVYGKRRVGGLLVYSHATSQGKHHWRYFVQVIAAHEIQAVTKYYLGDDEVTVDGSGAVTSGAYAGNCWIWADLGTDDSVANATFVSETPWTTDHRGRGIAKLYIKFHLINDIIAEGFPNITCEVQGKNNIYDPRDETYGYSANAALCAYDFLTLSRAEGGFGADGALDNSGEVDWDLVAAEANICDEPITLAAGGTEARYEVNAVVTTGSAPDGIRDLFVVAMAGRYAYIGGQHVIQAGIWRPVTGYIEEGDLVGPIQVSALTQGDEIANEVRAVYVSPADKYQPKDITPVTVDPDADPVTVDLDLPFTTSGTMAQRIAQIMLRRAQAEKSVALTENMRGLAIAALDTVQVNVSRYGLSNYAFNVAGWSLSLDPEWSGITMHLVEDNEEIYEWAVASETAPPAAAPTIVQPGATDTDNTSPLNTALISLSYVVGLAVTGTDAGTDASITIPTHNRIYSDKSVSVTGGTLTGLAFATTYFLYYDDADRSGGAVTYAATTVQADAVASTTNDDRHFVATITTPADGAADTVGYGALPPGFNYGWSF